MPTINPAVLVLAAYLWGCLSPSQAMARLLKGVDLDRFGSGNVGASNLGELAGTRWKVLIGAVDLFKGWAPPFVAGLLGYDPVFAALAGVAVVAGHNWSVFLGFKGGRGVAAMVGVLCALDFRLAILVVTAFGFGQLTNQGGPVSLLAMLLAAPAAWLLGDPPATALGCAAIGLLVSAKRLEANRLPLPADPGQRLATLWRRVWLDRDVPADQVWEKRGRFD